MSKGISNLKIEIIRKNIKNIYFRLKSDDVLVVTCNHYVSDEEIYHHLKNNEQKLMAKYEKLKTKSQETLIGIKENSIYFFGKKYILKKEYGNPKIIINDEEILIKNRSLHDEEILKTFYKLIKVYLNDFILKKQEKYLRYLNKYRFIDEIDYRYSLMKSLWGSCQPNKKIIRLNVKLIHFRKEIIESILVHELTHLLVANHSKDFYYHVLNMDVLYFDKMKYLKNHSF